MRKKAIPCYNLNHSKRDMAACQRLTTCPSTFSSGIYGLLGPNGAGKTTLLGMLMGAVRPDRGQMSYNRIPLNRNRIAFISKVGYLPQNPLFYKDFTAEDFLRYICELKDIPKPERLSQIEAVLDETNLTPALPQEDRRLFRGHAAAVGDRSGPAWASGIPHL